MTHHTSFVLQKKKEVRRKRKRLQDELAGYWISEEDEIFVEIAGPRGNEKETRPNQVAIRKRLSQSRRVFSETTSTGRCQDDGKLMDFHLLKFLFKTFRVSEFNEILMQFIPTAKGWFIQ